MKTVEVIAYCNMLSYRGIYYLSNDTQQFGLYIKLSSAADLQEDRFDKNTRESQNCNLRYPLKHDCYSYRIQIFFLLKSILYFWHVSVPNKSDFIQSIAIFIISSSKIGKI